MTTQPPEVRQKLMALQLWEIEHKIYNKADKPIENKGNYLIWRQYLLFQKATEKKLSFEV